MAGGGKLNIIDSNVTQVVGSQIGGIFAVSSGSLDILRCYFETASALFMGALMAASGTTAVITMRDSVARDMGRRDGWSWNAIMLFDGPTATVSNCRFEASLKGVFYLALVTPIRPHTTTNQSPIVSARARPPSYRVPSLLLA